MDMSRFVKDGTNQTRVFVMKPNQSDIDRDEVIETDQSSCL